VRTSRAPRGAMLRFVSDSARRSAMSAVTYLFPIFRSAGDGPSSCAARHLPDRRWLANRAGPRALNWLRSNPVGAQRCPRVARRALNRARARARTLERSQGLAVPVPTGGWSDADALGAVRVRRGWTPPNASQPSDWKLAGALAPASTPSRGVSRPETTPNVRRSAIGSAV